ncbi:MAG: response regulator receiver protein, partial [Hyphomicrobiales bacterium]|nr:response regulator receiver protein [Hyphomicrobiales bacterium]
AALAGRRVLVVEDEPFIAMTLEDMLTDLGCVVAGSASQIQDALEMIERGNIDAAVLDVNLGSQKIDPVADALAKLDCPFVFTTGYGRTGVPPLHNMRGVVQKPFRMEDLAKALSEELSRVPG